MSRTEGKTEKATPQRRREARREGRIPRSAEVGVAASFLAVAMGLKVGGPAALGVLERETAVLLAMSVDGIAPPAEAGAAAARMFLAAGVPFISVGVLIAVVAGVAQTGGAVSAKALQPKLSHLSPMRGLQRLKPSTGGWELARSVLKIALLVGLTWGPVTEWARTAPLGRGLDAGLATTMDASWTLLLRGLFAAALVAAADYLWNFRKQSRDMRMSKEEVKQESKNSDGDPLVKGQRRRRAFELSRGRMMSDVAGADVVITNPTHLAVALRYSAEEGAPKVVAKGADRVAAKIRGEARRHGVPVTEDKPLARALYRRCSVGSFVPAALFEAVAVVLALAYRRTGKAA